MKPRPPFPSNEELLALRQYRTSYINLSVPQAIFIDDIAPTTPAKGRFTSAIVWAGYQIYSCETAEWNLWLQEEPDVDPHTTQRFISGLPPLFDALRAVAIPGIKQGISPAARNMLRVFQCKTEL